MQKNQKYTQEEMYLAIELWKESGLSQNQFCNKENISLHTFKYWYKKYRKEKTNPQSKPSQNFIPVQVKALNAPIIEEQQDITIIYPNGIELQCPLNIPPSLLKTLLNL